MAIGVLSSLRGLGKKLPEDCAVVGCDDIDLAAHSIPALTTVHITFYEMGTEAMRLLIGTIMTGSPPPKDCDASPPDHPSDAPLPAT